MCVNWVVSSCTSSLSFLSCFVVSMASPTEYFHVPLDVYFDLTPIRNLRLNCSFYPNLNFHSWTFYFVVLQCETSTPRCWPTWLKSENWRNKSTCKVVQPHSGGEAGANHSDPTSWGWRDRVELCAGRSSHPKFRSHPYWTTPARKAPALCSFSILLYLCIYIFAFPLCLYLSAPLPVPLCLFFSQYVSHFDMHWFFPL